MLLLKIKALESSYPSKQVKGTSLKGNSVCTVIEFIPNPIQSCRPVKRFFTLLTAHKKLLCKFDRKFVWEVRQKIFLSEFALILKFFIQINLMFFVKYFSRRNLSPIAFPQLPKRSFINPSPKNTSDFSK